MKRIIFLFSLFAIAATSLFAQKPMQDPETELWGFVDNRGNWVIRPAFSKVLPLPFDPHTIGGFPKTAVVLVGSGWGVIDKKGEFVVKPVFDSHKATWAAKKWEAKEPLGRTLYALQDAETEKYGFVNYVGHWAILPAFSEVNAYSFEPNGLGGLAKSAVVKVGTGWGVIDKKGVFVVKPIFDNYNAYQNAKEWEKSQDAVNIPASQVANYSDLPTNGYSFPTATTVPATPSPILAQVQTVTPSQQQPATAQTIVPPTIVIVSPATGSNYDVEEVIVRYEVKTSDGKPAEIIVNVDSEPYDMTSKGVKRAFNELALTLPRKAGRTNIQLIARDSHGFVSEPVSLTLNYTGDRPKPTLHLFAVGVGSYSDPNIGDLDLAAKDASDMVEVITGIENKAYGKIEPPVLLTDGEATAVKLKTELMALANRARQEDVVMLYFSGHGAKENDVTYFLSSDAVSGNLYATAVNFDDIKTVSRILVDKHCKVVVFMDSCHAGSLYNTKSYNQTLQFAAPGVITFCSSTSSQKSNEAEKWQNGVFTRALVDGVKGMAKDENGNVTIVNLEHYVKNTVEKETKGTQTPIVNTGDLGNWILF